MKQKIIKFFKQISLVEYIIFSFCLVLIIVVSIIFKVNILDIIFAFFGLLMLLFVSKGFIIGEGFSIVYMILYAFIAYFNHYYGEMFISIFISVPLSIFTFIAWIKHPFKSGEQEVKISELSIFSLVCIITFSILLGFPIYFLLKDLNTPNLIFSTLSIIASLIASLLLLFRSNLYALFFIINDLIVITLWILTIKQNLNNVLICTSFFINLVFDIYGLINWSKIKKKQA